VWNNGDNSDTMDGGDGTDEIEVNGAATAGDVFTVAANGQRVRFDRTNLVPFTLDISAERMALNGLGGADAMSAGTGLAPLTSITMNGGVGADSLSGGDGGDLITGGDAVDTLSGNGGADRIVGDRGDDVMTGGAGDDTLVWNNGDNSDTMDGQDGLDRVEVNGAGAGDVFTVAPNGARAKLDRTNLVPFTLNVGSTEALDLRGLGGDDSFVAAAGTPLAVIADGGPGNDAFTGADEPDTFLGDSGNDTLNGGAGPDLLDGQDGDDSLLARDGAGDLVRGGIGTDSAQADAATVDAVDGVESIDRPAPADATATPVDVQGRRANIRINRRGRASTRIRLLCPAGETGGCEGTLTLLTNRKFRVGRVSTRVVIATKRFDLDAGERRRITVRLPKGIRSLARNRRIQTRVQTASTDAAGNLAQKTERLTLRLPRR
jgi:Ca2+-binding RTX toxin-like protein